MYLVRTLAIFGLIAGLAFLGFFQFYNPGTLTVTIPFIGSLPGKEAWIPVFRFDVPNILMVLLPVAMMAVMVVLMATDLAHQGIFVRRWFDKRNRIKAEILCEEASDLILRGSPELAVAVLERAQKLSKDYLRTYLLLGDAHRNMGNLEKAVEVHEQALVLRPASGSALLAEVRDLELRQETASARRLMTKIMDSEGLSLTALLEYRKVLLDDGLYEEALKIQKKVVSLFKIKDDAQRDVLRGIQTRLALQEARSGKPRKALRLLHKLVRSKPSFVDGHLALAEAYALDGKPAKGIETLRRAFGKVPSEKLLGNYFDVLAHRPQEEQVGELRVFLEEHGQHPVGLFYLARFYFQKGINSQAKILYQRLANMGVPFAEAYANLATIERLEGENFKQVAEYLQRAYKIEVDLTHEWICRHCGTRRTDWVAYCPACHHWDTYEGNLAKMIEAQEEGTVG